MGKFDQHYELIEALAKQSRLISPPVLYDADDKRVYAAYMDRLAQPLPTGQPSPFTNRSPGSAHGILLGNLAHLQGLLGHQINLIPDATWVQVFRLMGIELLPAEYPIINIVFERSPEGISANQPAYIPAGTEVRSRLSQLSAYTLSDLQIANGITATVPARLSRLGPIPSGLRVGEFNDIPHLTFVNRAYNDGIVFNPGRNRETLAEAMLRAREFFRTGGRCVTPQDYATFADRFGSRKTNVLVGVNPNVEGFFGNLVSVIVYPPTIAPAVEVQMMPLVLSGYQFRCVGAEIIPVSGRIEMRIDPSIERNAFNLAASAIVEEINPPNGLWGDRNFERSLSIALERVPGIYAVPSLKLVRETDGEPLENVEVKPWHLFEVQSSTELIFLMA